MAEERISEILWDQLTINERDALNTGICPPSPKTTPKKKAGSHLVRDSQAFRESPGKPGSKRFNRYLNNKYLKDGGIFSGSEDIELEYCLVECNESLLYQDGDNMKVWEPFINISLDKQERKLQSIRKVRGIKSPMAQKKIDKSFSKLRKDLREEFKKPYLRDSAFIKVVEEKMIEFIQNDDIRTTEVVLENSYQRLLLHGIGSYYSVFTTSYTNESGDRVTVIRKPKIMPSTPELSITGYIIQQQDKQQHQKNNIYKKQYLQPQNIRV